MRKCPTAPNLLGRESIWDLTTTEFMWIIENLSEEFKQIEQANKRKR